MRRTNRHTAVTRSAERLHQRPGGENRPARSKRSRKASLPFNGRKPQRTPRGLPPVLVRTETPVVESSSVARGKNRRRYDVALSVPGAELRLPSLPQVRFSWRILSGLLVLALAGALYYAMTSPIFLVSSAQIEGLQRLTETDIETVLRIEDEPIFTLNPGELRENLQMAFPELSEVVIRVELPAEVLIGVVERQPVLAWREGEHETWVDLEGVSFPPRGDPGHLVVVEGNSAPVIPTAEGEIPAFSLPPELVNALLEVGTRAPENTRLAFDSQRGLGWEDERGWRAYFGTDLKDIDMKLQVYETLAKSLWDEGIVPSMISVEFLHAPYYRVER